MMNKKRKIPWFFIIIGAVVSGYGGYLLNGAWVIGGGAGGFAEALERVMAEPFTNYFNDKTIQAVAIAVFIYTIAIVMYFTGRRNLMPGREYGTAKYAEIKQVNRFLADKDNANNRILSQNVRMSLDTRATKLNNNVLIIGGSGAGKTFYEVKPNLMQLPRSSFICTDPKGELLRSCGGMLKRNGYNVKVLNLLEMESSDCYNPFRYIRDETDIVKLITNIISNTTPKGSTPTDPFWEKAEGLFLQAIFLYVWLEVELENRNFETVLKLLGEAEVVDNKRLSPLTVRMNELEKKSPLGANHPAVKQYNKCIRGAGDTVRSIIISANSRLAFLENQKVLRILSRDEMNLAELGIGVNGDKTTKTALFCVIPDSDKSYNFIVGMLYTQIFQELYYQADFNFGGRLPIHVTFMLDEFANVALPDDYCSLLSTMRSREISSVIIIQNLAQIKALFKDTWETIPGNCDTLIYLGGNEQSTHKYISELLGKGTIDKRSNGETRGKNGSASRNFDVLGRELLTADETRKMNNKKCLVFIRGFDPIVDNKYIPFKHPVFDQTADGKSESYIHKSSKNKRTIGPLFEILGKNSLEYYKNLEKSGDKVSVNELTFNEFMMLGEPEMKRLVGISITGKAVQYAGEASEARTDKGAVQEDEQDDASGCDSSVDGRELILEYQEDNEEADSKVNKRKNLTHIREKEDSIWMRISKWPFTIEQKQEINHAIDVGMNETEILEFMYPDMTPGRMKEIISRHRG